jgi:YbgC/YbaW family acyl-CoA thioester hydrolase
MTRRIEFADTDMAGIVHFSRYFLFMEETEHAFLRSLGFSVVSKQGNETIGWPRVSAACEFRRPLHFEDEVEIRLRVAEKSRSSLTYEFSFVRGEAEAARGKVTTVCCRVDSSGKLESIAIPSEISEAIQASIEGSSP